MSNIYQRYPEIPPEILDALSYGDLYEVFQYLTNGIMYISGTTRNKWSIGPGNTSNDIDIKANFGGPNDPILRYNKTTQKWTFSNDGITFQDFGSGSGFGSGFSGYSGYSGATAQSGYSGQSGQSGYSGYSGTSIIYTESSGVTPNLLERVVYLDNQAQKWIVSTVIS